MLPHSMPNTLAKSIFSHFMAIAPMIKVGISVNTKPNPIHNKPSGRNTVSKKCAPASSPRHARYIDSPKARNMRFALRVVYVIMCNRGPNVPKRMPTMIGPPARPNLTGVEMPGMAMGNDPSTSPSTIPINMTTRFGSLRLFTALPSTFSTFRMAADSPTTVNRSPSWSTSSGVARSCTPER